MGDSRIAALLVNVLVSLVFAAFGYFASKGNLWAFVIGLSLYILDVFSLVLVRDYQNVNYLSVIFHIIAAFLIFRGLLACRRVQLENALN
jgi:low affinity Fe/Cu permease